MSTRRVFLSTLGSGLLVAPLVARAQLTTKSPPRIGYLGNGDPKGARESLDAFRQGLRDLGWIEGQNVQIEYRWAHGESERLRNLAAELVRAQSDLLVVSGSPGIEAARAATGQIPIVIAALLVDPVAAGFVGSLAHPGGNITGLVSQYEEIVTKQVQLLTEAIPGLSRLALLRDKSFRSEQIAGALGAAEALGLRARFIEVGQPADFDGAFQAAHDGHAQAVQVLPSPWFNVHRRLLITLAARYHLPAMYEFRDYVRDGGLMSYGVSVPDMYRRSARYVDQILKGAKPGDLPIERPAKFDLVINLTTAKALGLSVPRALLARADEVIQ
jgi:putative tryptophan/tyrosine transport system substrate-binding protein